MIWLMLVIAVEVGIVAFAIVRDPLKTNGARRE
jgi:hypothetical protein